MVHLMNILLSLYLDDWLVQVVSYQLGLVRAQTMLELCDQLGLIVNMTKSELTPSQDCVFIGARFSLSRSLVFSFSGQCHKSCQTGETFQTEQSSNSQEMAIPHRNTGLSGQVHPICQVSHQTNTVASEPGVESDKRLQSQIIGDSTVHKGSAVLVGTASQTVSGSTSPSPSIPVQSVHRRIHLRVGRSSGGAAISESVVSTRKQLHINVLEMRAIINTLSQCALPPQAKILVATDNKTVLAYVNKEGGTKSWYLMKESCVLFRLIMGNQWVVKASYIPGSLKVIADQLSRKGQILPTEWSLHRDVIQWLFHKWGTPIVDLFASRYNNKCPVFCVSGSGPSSLGGGRVNPGPRGVECVCVSSSADTPQVSPEVSSNQVLQSHSSRSFLAQTTMVPTVVTTGSGGSSSSSQLAQSAQTTSVHSNEWQGGDSKTPRLAAREVSLQSGGFVKEVIDKRTEPHAPSTELIYDGKWRIWTAWCIRNGVVCYNPPVAKVADFFTVHIHCTEGRILNPCRI